MARDFDGTDDKLDLGSDASIDDFDLLTISLWAVRDVDNLVEALVCKSDTGSVLAFLRGNNAAGNRPQFQRKWLTTNGNWLGDVAILVGQLRHLAVTYNGTDPTNKPTFYVDGVEVTRIDVATPLGGETRNSDAALALLAGIANLDVKDSDGRISHLNYANALWDAAQINRARWWGRPGGAQAVYHPLITDKLANEGTATADAVATGTTVGSIPRVERCWGSLMGVGR